MVVIGLTGGIGSGKSTVSQLFADLGITIIDTDIIAREVVKPNSAALDQIKQHFGPTIINKNAELDRGTLRKKIFSDPKEKVWLENLLHPLIRAEAQRQANAATSPYCIVVIPLLFETGSYPWLNRILTIETDAKMQIERVINRDQSTQEEVKKIMASQHSSDHRRKAADDVLENTGSIAVLRQAVEKLHQFYLNLSVEK